MTIRKNKKRLLQQRSWDDKNLPSVQETKVSLMVKDANFYRRSPLGQQNSMSKPMGDNDHGICNDRNNLYKFKSLDRYLDHIAPTKKKTSYPS